MAQSNKTVSLLIKDSKGQQQILQVKSPNMKTIIKDDPDQSYPQKFTSGQKYIALNNPKMVINSTTPRTVVSGAKTIVRLSPQQMSQMKVISSPSSSQSGMKISPLTKTLPVNQMPQSTNSYEIPSTSASVPVKTTPYNTPSNVSTPTTTASRKTPQTSSSQIHTPASRRRKTDKIGRGLRHFSMKVCEKVKEKGTTTYNEVADELVAEETSGVGALEPGSYDQKNIRRRVYDALNVLMAMNIISKEKKEIRWHGLPTNTIQEVDDLEKENEQLRQRVELKQQQLRELILQHVAFKALVQRNKDNEERGIVPSPSSAIQLPFIIVNTDKKTHINCSISNDKSEYSFKFDDTFEIHDDMEVLKRMGLLSGLDRGTCSEEDIIKIKSLVPEKLEKYIDAYGRGVDDDVLLQDWDDTYQSFTCDESMTYNDNSASYSMHDDQDQYDDDSEDDGV